MDLVSNYIGELAASQTGGKKNGTASNIDLNDSTFSDLLEKQLNNTLENNNQVGKSDVFLTPSGIDIGDFDGNVPRFKAINDANYVNNTQNTDSNIFSNLKEYTAQDILTFFPSIFDSRPTLTQTANNGLFDFERKSAVNLYGRYTKNIVTNLGEFVSDALR